jgi:hypothetical protein
MRLSMIVSVKLARQEEQQIGFVECLLWVQTKTVAFRGQTGEVRSSREIGNLPGTISATYVGT